LNDPWGDLVNYFREVRVTQVKYRLLAAAVFRLPPGAPIAEPLFKAAGPAAAA
jgi:hypothetical protein